jgi:hypothetical protein
MSNGKVRRLLHSFDGPARLDRSGRIQKMKVKALQYYMHDGPAAFRFELAGDLSDEGAHRLEQDWRAASSVIGDRQLIVDITFVTSVEKKAGMLLAGWHASGARLIANSNDSRLLAQSILGEALPEPRAITNPTWVPFRASLLVRPAIMLLMATAVFPIDANAATLKPETVADWENLHTMSSVFEDRCSPGGAVLWLDEAPERLAKVHD